MLSELPPLWLLLAACAVNAAGDVLLLWGSRHTNWKPGFEALAKTPPSFVRTGALVGLVTIPCWFLAAPFIALIPGDTGAVAYISFCSYVAAALAFHVCYGFIGAALHSDPDLKTSMESLAKPLLLFCFMSAVVASVAIAYAGADGRLVMVWYHYAFLPAPAIILIQMGLGGALKGVPFFQIISGPAAMAAFFVSFHSLIAENTDVLLVR